MNQNPSITLNPLHPFQMKTIHLITFFFFIVIAGFSQTREVTPLNEHFWPLESGSGAHTYNSIKKISEDEVHETILNLENIPVEISTTKYKDPDREKILMRDKKRFDASRNLVAIEVLDNTTSMSVLQVFDSTKLVLELNCIYSNCTGEFYPVSRIDTLEVHQDIFKPSIVGGVEAWQKFLTKNLKYPKKALSKKLEGDVWVGVKVAENGDLQEVVALNPNKVDQLLIEEVLRIFVLYKGGFNPALDFNGEPIASWIYLPVKFKLGFHSSFRNG